MISNIVFLGIAQRGSENLSNEIFGDLEVAIEKMQKTKSKKDFYIEIFEIDLEDKNASAFKKSVYKEEIAGGNQEIKF
jgi:hypothetical protein